MHGYAFPRMTRYSEPEGSWSSPGYRSVAVRSQSTLVLLGLTGALDAATFLYLLPGIPLVDRIQHGSATPAEVNEFVSVSATLDGLWALLFVATAIAFLAWLYGSVRNTPPLGGGVPYWSPAWSVGWWFVPIANLYFPYKVVRELYDRLWVPEAPRGGGYVVAWWLIWLAGNLLIRGSANLYESAPDTDQLRVGLMVNAVGEALLVAAAILAIVIVREIQVRAEIRVRMLRPAPPVPQVGWYPSGPPTMPPLSAGSRRRHSTPLGSRRPRSRRPPLDSTDAAYPFSLPSETSAPRCPTCGTPSEGARLCHVCGSDLSSV